MTITFSDGSPTQCYRAEVVEGACFLVTEEVLNLKNVIGMPLSRAQEFIDMLQDALKRGVA